MATHYHHGNLREALLASAGELLEDEGLDAITWRRLAGELGVSHAAPGHHFRDKDDLLAALARQGFEWLQADMAAELHDGAAPDDELAAIGRGYLRFALANPARFRLMFSGMAAIDCDDQSDLEAAADTAFATLVRVASGSAGATSPDPRDQPEAWLAAWALVHGLATLYVDGQLDRGLAGPDPQAEFLRLSNTILSGSPRSRHGE